MNDKIEGQLSHMRCEAEMLDLILATARQDDRIRAVILNGSRVNPNIQPDRFQDFDMVYLVTQVAPFINDPTWIDRFGELMILQMPDLMGEAAPRQDGGCTYLMQFTDGNRIDLNLIPVENIEDMEDDSLSVLLLDKDGRLPPFPPPSEASYLPSPPTAKAFAECCNEFWWVAPYVAKALARGDILYARHLLDDVLRGEHMKILTWQFGIQTDFKRNPGKFGQHFPEYMPEEQWDQLLGTYSKATLSETWESLFKITMLFRDSAEFVGKKFKLKYPLIEDRQVSAFLRKIQKSGQ